MDEHKIAILADAAKYDVSCSSSGSDRKYCPGEIGNAAFSGICHTFTADGRCVSLLKLLLSNDCAYDCAYCRNRRSNSLPRATAQPDEICRLTMAFYKRNYIEGLFLSSAVYKNPNYTMELLLETARKLREEYKFNGYIHLKGMPSADKLLIERAAKYADRMSLNIELPSENSLKLLAPQKSAPAIITPMRMLADKRKIFIAERGAAALPDFSPVRSENRKREYFLPAGQTTQMIIGASPEPDSHILKLSQALYKNFGLKRVYYSAYQPVPGAGAMLPLSPAPKLREHRLYQADWLLRFYGFTAEEITDGGNLSLEQDPKCAWALKNMQHFPVEINSAPLSVLLRVPGIGVKSAYRIISARKYTKLDFADLKRMRVTLKRAMHFITCKGKFFGSENVRALTRLLSSPYENARQLSFFSPDYYKELHDPKDEF